MTKNYRFSNTVTKKLWLKNIVSNLVIYLVNQQNITWQANEQNITWTKFRYKLKLQRHTRLLLHAQTLPSLHSVTKYINAYEKKNAQRSS